MGEELSSVNYSMGNEVNSLKSLKKNNKSSILRLLYDNGAMSRLELAKETGLTTASITVLVKDLMSCGAIIESGSVQRNKSGRREVLLDINYKELRVANITIESDKIYFSICNRYETLIEKTFDSSVIQQADPLNPAEDDILGNHWSTQYKIRCIGIGVIGKVDTEKGILIDSRGLFPPNFPLRKVLSMQYPYPIIITNNVRAQAYSIITSELNDFLYVKHGPKLGGAIVSNGRIVRGSGNEAGEIGQTQVRNIQEKITLGDYVSEKRIRKRYEMETSKDLEAEEIYKLFSTDKVAYCVISDCLKQISDTVANIGFIIDPAKIILSGGMFLHDDIFEKLCALIKDAGYLKPVIRPTNSDKLKFLSSGIVALKFCLFGLIKPDAEDDSFVSKNEDDDEEPSD